jgi:hypothetical protein
MSRGNQQPPAYWSLVEPLWDSISIYDGPEVFQRQFAGARPEAGLLLAAHWCQSEVSNGGFEQFFSNPTGVLAPEALDAFRAIGLHEWAAILEEAMRFFGEPYPRDQRSRERKLARPRGVPREQLRTFSAHDDRFYDWSRREPGGFERLADAYARSVGA